MSVRLGPGGEFDLIRRFLAGAGDLRSADVLVGPGDDCAVVRSGEGAALAITTDASVDGIHFRRDWLSDEEIGYRAATGGLSDLAAMAAHPIGVLVSLLAPEMAVPRTAEALMRGVTRAAQAVGAVVLGGDVARSPEALALDIVSIGTVERPVTRAGALPGDELWVTGRLGGAGAAVRMWLAGTDPSDAARAAFAHPVARVREARWLAERSELHALIDLSDGLAGDAAHIAAASGVRVVLERAKIPVHRAAVAWAEEQRDPDGGVALALGGGEDYELCFAASPGDVARHVAVFERTFDAKLTRVGQVERGTGVVVRNPDGAIRSVDVAGFRHF